MIGFGSPNKQGKEECHGAALGAEEVALTRAALGWNHAPFEIPAELYAEWDAKAAGAAREAEWNQRFVAYQAEYPELAAEFLRRSRGELPESFAAQAAEYVADVAAVWTDMRLKMPNGLWAEDAFFALVDPSAGGSRATAAALISTAAVAPRSGASGPLADAALADVFAGGLPTRKLVGTAMNDGPARSTLRPDFVPTKSARTQHTPVAPTTARRPLARVPHFVARRAAGSGTHNTRAVDRTLAEQAESLIGKV